MKEIKAFRVYNWHDMREKGGGRTCNALGAGTAPWYFDKRLGWILTVPVTISTGIPKFGH